MAKFISGRQRNIQVGVSSYTENQTSLEIIGKVGIGTTVAQAELNVVFVSKWNQMSSFLSEHGVMQGFQVCLSLLLPFLLPIN